MKKIYIHAASVLLAVSSLTASANDVYIGGTLGGLLLDDDRLFDNNDDNTLTGGLNFGVDTGDYAAEFSFDQYIEGADISLYSLSAYKFLDDRYKDDIWAPYIVGGYTYSDMGDSADLISSADSLHLGVGLAKFLSEQLEFRGDVRAYGSFSEETNPGGVDDSLLDVGIKLALNYHFGRATSATSAQYVEPAPAAEPAPAPVAVPVAEPVYLTRTIELNVLFATNADTALSYGDEVDEIGQAMAENANLQLSLEGHTDSMGAAEYNKDLSQRRAETVRSKIISDYGIAGSRIRAMGYGEERPVASNETSQGRAQNRRVVGVLSWEELAD